MQIPEETKLTESGLKSAIRQKLLPLNITESDRQDTIDLLYHLMRTIEQSSYDAGRMEVQAAMQKALGLGRA